MTTEPDSQTPPKNDPVPFVDDAPEEYVALRRKFQDQIDKNVAKEHHLATEFSIGLTRDSLAKMRQVYILIAVGQALGLDLENDYDDNLGLYFEAIFDHVAVRGTVARAQIEVDWQEMIGRSLLESELGVVAQRAKGPTGLQLPSKELLLPGKGKKS